MELDSSKVSGPNCIPVVIVQDCEPELSDILAELFNKCQKESCFLDCWKVSLVVHVFKNVEESSTAKSYHIDGFLSLVSTVKNYHFDGLLSLVSKVFEKLVNNRLIDHLEKCDYFSDFQYGFSFLDQLHIL